MANQSQANQEARPSFQCFEYQNDDCSHGRKEEAAIESFPVDEAMHPRKYVL